MPYTIEDYKRERAQGLWPLPAGHRAMLEFAKQLPLEERLELTEVSAEELEEYLKQLQKKAATPKKRPKRRR